MIYLSHIIDKSTPTYGNRNDFEIIKKSDILKGDVANDSYISTTAHIGTHIDMPYHFHSNGQTIEDYEASFWVFKKPLIIELYQDELIIYKKLIEKLEVHNDLGYDIIIIKTASHKFRENPKFWKENFGFHPDIYDYIINKFVNVRVLGFDSISVSSFNNRLLGREAHKRFLNPKKPILLLEDMKLDELNENSSLTQIIVAPMLIKECDGLPCTVFGIVEK